MKLLWVFLCVFVSSYVCGVEWFNEGPIYQVYVASFADTDGDGWGDLKGKPENIPYFHISVTEISNFLILT